MSDRPYYECTPYKGAFVGTPGGCGTRFYADEEPIKSLLPFPLGPENPTVRCPECGAVWAYWLSDESGRKVVCE